MEEREMQPRAPRLLLKAPVVLRSSPRAKWKPGWTVNLSHSGVLVVLNAPAEIEGDVEFVIQLSKVSRQGPGVALLPDLHCRGHIVRHETGPEGQTLVAANIRRQSIRANAPKRAGQ